jgi:hypothetical protein
LKDVETPTAVVKVESPANAKDQDSSKKSNMAREEEDTPCNATASSANTFGYEKYRNYPIFEHIATPKVVLFYTF